MFYNVENLFDTRDDPDKRDEDYLEGGFMRWNTWKYREKLRNITRVITAVGEMHPPALVGLCEVENDSVLYDLTQRSPLRAQDYHFIITHSPDERGIDVALLYQRHQFCPLQINEYALRANKKGIRPTRNILHVTGKVISGDTLDVFVCHWPSRRGGAKESRPAREAVAALLKFRTDSLFLVRPSANILIMGDFNTTPTDQCLTHILKAECVTPSPKRDGLYNLFLPCNDRTDTGTYKYKGIWEILDQFIVSGNLLAEGNGLRIQNQRARIFRPEFLLTDDERYYGKKPFRTNTGPRFVGGFSDHLPIYLNLTSSSFF